MYLLHSLLVGCGNSNFSYDIFCKGDFTNITSIDYSENVIDAMKYKYSEYPELKWICADMTELDEDAFPVDSFACVIYKAAMDALMSEVRLTYLVHYVEN